MQAFSSRDETVPAPAPNGTRVLYTNDPSVCDAVSAPFSPQRSIPAALLFS